MSASHPSHQLPGATPRRVRHPLAPRRAPLEPGAARRFSIALACLGVSYALAWIELPLGQIAPTSTDGAISLSSTLAAALTARVIVGLLYAFVALRRPWARWITVVLCFASVAFVGPLLPVEWRIFPLGALVTGLGLAGKLIAAVLLTLPLRTRSDTRP
ncbi:hypothetical protein [Trinickia acidisoli]|uniref:hypothetical protein n=1 Tax=Trinickia acidisoli TaxID=2767482 RepID=UPI001A8EC904|nr:hypothetical protein [Trinickia acidisoli]